MPPYPLAPDQAAARDHAPFLDKLRAATPLSFADALQFNTFCKAAIAAWKETHPTSLTTTQNFSSVLADLRSESPSGIAIKCPWGGVLVKEIDETQTKIGKYLAVEGGKYLAFEWHYEKDETLSVREGVGLLIYRKAGEATLQLAVMTAGQSISLAPKEEHCLIALEDLLVYETSVDRRGMDKDLQFVFMPD
jgi:hypothetical protein